MNQTYDLSCRYDARQNFYGKAKVEVYLGATGGSVCLYSYGTLVAEVITEFNGKKIYKYLGKFSQTTTRHQKEFFKQQDLSEKEIKELFKNGVLIKENN